jgi:hypothetical protein
MIVRILTATSLLAAPAAFAAPTKPKQVSSVVITNSREVQATEVAIGANGQTVRLSKPLAPKAQATLRLPKMAGCMVDVCKDRAIRFTD